MTTGRISLGSDLLLARPLTDHELEERYGGRRLRRSDDWFEMYEEPLELPLSSRRKYLVPAVGVLIVGAAVLAGYALQKNDWRAITDAQQALRKAFDLEAPEMLIEPLAERDRVWEVRRFSAGPVVRISTAVAEVSYDRAAPEPDPDVRSKPEPRSTETPRPTPRRPVYEPPAVSEGSRVIEAPIEPEPGDEDTAADDAGSHSIEAPAQPSEPEPEPAIPEVPDYGI